MNKTEKKVTLEISPQDISKIRDLFQKFGINGNIYEKDIDLHNNNQSIDNQSIYNTNSQSIDNINSQSIDNTNSQSIDNTNSQNDYFNQDLEDELDPIIIDDQETSQSESDELTIDDIIQDEESSEIFINE
ncbi:putative BTB_POZ domain-containing protein [Megavirus courdo7]|uniref:Putative BTB_POZ domain-containing protein n=1 Tax=Megavirus courdo7 TaxID=1128135 RepID=H2EBQ6_9VIRU|nr:putative BTB_POZ domain-containing protein [Megavirus courdo7]